MTAEQFSHRTTDELEQLICDYFEELCKRRLNRADKLFDALEKIWATEAIYRPIPHRKSA